MARYDKAIIVLSNDIIPSIKRGNKWAPDVFSISRLHAASLLYREEEEKNAISPLFIISGGRFYGASAPCLSDVLAHYALRNKLVISRDLRIERKSLTTEQNLNYVIGAIHRPVPFWPTVDTSQLNQITVVTSNFHLNKARVCAHRARKGKGFNGRLECVSAEEIYKRQGNAFLLRETKKGHGEFRKGIRHNLGAFALGLPGIGDWLVKMHDRYALVRQKRLERQYAQFS